MDAAENYQLELPYKPSSVSVYWKRITIPKGLPALLETFVKECIRQSPDDIYNFLADLTESLLVKRSEENEAESAPTETESGIKKEKQADEESPLLDSPSPVHTSYLIESQKEAQVKREESTAQTQKASESSPPPEEDGESLAEETAAASKIQAGFRGFKTRKTLREKKEKDSKSRPDPLGSPSPVVAVVPEPEPTESTVTSPANPEDEVIVEKVTTSEVATSPPPGNEVDDEEIAAELKTPLETIREESFDHSTSPHPTTLALAPPENSNPTKESAPSNVLVEESEQEDSPSPEEALENEVADKEISEPAVTLKKTYTVDVISLEDINSALQADSTSEESGEDPSLKETSVTKETHENNNDIGDKNDETPSSPQIPSSPSSPSKENDESGNIPDGGEENSAKGQENGDQQLETAPTTGDVVVDKEENPERECIEDNSGNGADGGEEPSVINLSSSVDHDEDCVDDQIPISAEEEGDVEDKNKKSDGTDEEVGEENTTNIIADSGPPEVGQPAEDVGGGDEERGVEESIEQQQSGSALTESSGDREDTDIQTPTDFSVQEEKDSEIYDELKVDDESLPETPKFPEEEEKVEETMEGGNTAEPIPVATPTEQKSEEGVSSSEASSSGGEGGAVLQVEMKPNEAVTPENASAPSAPTPTSVESPPPSGGEPGSPEAVSPPPATPLPEVTSPAPSADEKPVEVASPTPTDTELTAEKVEGGVTSPLPEPVATSESSTPVEAKSPEPVATPESSAPAEVVKSPEPPFPILRPEGGESELTTSPTPTADSAVSPSPSVPAETPTEAAQSPEPSAEAVKSPEPTPEAAKSPEPIPEAAKSPEPTPEAAKSPEPTPEAAKSPEHTPEAEKSPEPTPEAAKSPKPLPETPTTPEAVSSPPPADSASPTEDKKPEDPTPPPQTSPTSPEPTPQPTEAIKTDSPNPVTSPAPPATPAPEEIPLSPAPTPSEEKSESPTTTTTAETVVDPTNPAKSDSVTNNSPPVAGDSSDQVTAPVGDSAVDTANPSLDPTSTPESSASVPTESAAPVAEKKKDIARVVGEEKVERIEGGEPPPVRRQDKPVVKPRLNSRQGTLTTEEKEESSPVSVLSAEASQIPDSPPVLRRPKSGSGRSRAATSKYRSGVVIENQYSMEQMEKDIEAEMMNTAATKIQANFRGFKTRKVLSGVSKRAKSEEPSEADIASATAITEEFKIAEGGQASALRLSPDSDWEEKGEFNLASSAPSLSSRGGKPPLGYLRSRSYPGSHEEDSPIMAFDEGEEDRLLNPEPDIDLELDPGYIDRAATRIQANFRGYQVRKSFKRTGGKENNDDKALKKSQKMAKADIEAEERAKVMETHERLQDRDEDNVSLNSESSAEPEKAAAKIQASFRSYKERQKFHQKKKAAITIQANIRGFLTRKRLANMRRRSFQRRRSSAKAFQKELEQMRKVNEAATKIQAVFRGYQVRSKMPRSGMINEEEEHIIQD